MIIYFNSYPITTFNILRIREEGSIKLSFDNQIIGLIDYHLLLLLLLMQITIIFFNSSRQFFKQVLSLLQFFPTLFFELQPFLFPCLFLFLLHLFIIELTSSLLGANHVLEVIVTILSVKSHRSVSFGLLVETFL